MAQANREVQVLASRFRFTVGTGDTDEGVFALTLKLGEARAHNLMHHSLLVITHVIPISGDVDKVPGGIGVILPFLKGFNTILRLYHSSILGAFLQVNRSETTYEFLFTLIYDEWFPRGFLTGFENILLFFPR